DRKRQRDDDGERDGEECEHRASGQDTAQSRIVEQADEIAEADKVGRRAVLYPEHAEPEAVEDRREQNYSEQGEGRHDIGQPGIARIHYDILVKGGWLPGWRAPPCGGAPWRMSSAIVAAVEFGRHFFERLL